MMRKIVLVIVVVWVFSACTTTKYVPVESVRVEYRDKEKEVTTSDSIIDNHFIYIKGDSIIDYRNRIKWRDRLVYIHDSICITDTIREPYPVERPLTKWERAKMDFGGMVFGALAIAICVAVVWLVRAIRRKN